MTWVWHWWLFGIAFVIITIATQFARGFMNATYVAREGPDADYKNHPLRAIFASIMVGATNAAVLTAIAGFIF
jgi:hypothetical protein